MLDERPSAPDANDPEGLGLDASDLADFEPVEGTEGDVGDQESTLGGPPALITEEHAAPAKADQQPTPQQPAKQPTDAAPPAADKPEQDQGSITPSRFTERQPAAAGEKPTAAAPSAPTPDTSKALVPWEPAADGRRLAIEGATLDADGNLHIPAAALKQLHSHLAFRPAWQAERARLESEVEARDPQHNEEVILSKILTREMAAAAEKDETGEALYEWCRGFFADLPRLRAEAKARAVDAENKRLKGRIEGVDREAEWRELEPEMKSGLSRELDQYLELPAFAALKPQRAALANRLWSELFDQVFSRADRDYPEWELKQGQVFVQRGVIERELKFAASLLTDQQKAVADQATREAATKRNAAALAETKVPASAPVGSGVITDQDAANAGGKPKDPQAWRDRMEGIADGAINL